MFMRVNLKCAPPGAPTIAPVWVESELPRLAKLRDYSGPTTSEHYTGHYDGCAMQVGLISACDVFPFQ